MEKIKIYGIAGPTASGKTALSVELAKRLNGEIISCDSMQIYKGMDIGTAKVTKEEMQGIPHHLIDIVEPTDNFSCSDYAKMAENAINDIVQRGKTPIFCGGTGLYLSAAIEGVKLSSKGSDEELRAELSKKDKHELFLELQKTDPDSAEKTHENNVKRVIRALEIYYTTGKTKTEWDKESKTEESKYDAKIICLDFKDREKLYERIDKRVDEMIKNGLVDEVKKLDCEKFRKSTAGQGIGYKEIIEFLDGKSDFETAVNEIKQASRNYAKRQLTWFRHKEGMYRIYVDLPENTENFFEHIVNSSLNYLNIH